MRINRKSFLWLAGGIDNLSDIRQLTRLMAVATRA